MHAKSVSDVIVDNLDRKVLHRVTSQIRTCIHHTEDHIQVNNYNYIHGKSIKVKYRRMNSLYFMYIHTYVYVCVRMCMHNVHK